MGGEGRSGRTDRGTVAIIREIVGVRIGAGKFLGTGKSMSIRSFELDNLPSADIEEVTGLASNSE